MYYVDMHCHSAFKPYSWSLSENGKNPYECRNVRSSLWYNDPPNDRDKRINLRSHFTKFTQSDFRTLTKGDVKILSACLSPVERDLFRVPWPLTGLGYRAVKYLLETSDEYISIIRKKERDYFDELQKEYCFYVSEERRQRKKCFPTHFKLISDFKEIDPDLKAPEKDTIFVFFSIEGCHVFNNGGLENIITDQAKVKENIQEVKEWKYRPLYVAMAHTMYNGLCGHAKSLPSFWMRILGQTKGMDEGFSKMGKVVRKKLLEKPGRIYIDIKHMNVKSRIEYYGFLDSKENEGDCIPVIVSHGAVNGRPSIKEPDKKNKDNTIITIYQSELELEFNPDDVNFFDDEIINIQETRGFLGIQLDERRLYSKEQKELGKRKKTRGEQLYHQAGLVWKQIRYIAEVLDKKEKFGWGTATIGSDFDGMVDPPNGYWTSDDFGILEENLIHHAGEYFSKCANHRLKHERNKLKSCQDPAQYVIDLFMRGNARRFLKDFLGDDDRDHKKQKKVDPCKEVAMKE